MGCDIHMHTEVKIDGRWEHYSEPDMDRNYALFGTMAGVRNDEVETIVAPKGLPDDISSITKLDYDYWRADAHTMSWFNADEIEKANDWLKTYMEKDAIWLERRYWGYLFGNSWGGWNKYPDERPEGIEDIRFVFWFDN